MSSMENTHDESWNSRPAPAATKQRAKSVWARSAGAVLTGFVSVVVLSLATDQVLHVLEIYPPWGEPMHAAGLNLLALVYRCVFGVIGGYVTARLSPRDPQRHVNVLGVLGTLIALAGALATVPLELGPAWYPIALVVTAWPGCWLGGVFCARSGSYER